MAMRWRISIAGLMIITTFKAAHVNASTMADVGLRPAGGPHRTLTRDPAQASR